MIKSPTPTVGRIVHFYSTPVANRDPSNGSRGHNGQGEGPYAAMITQIFSGAESEEPRFVNLLVFPPFAEPFHEGSVSELDPEAPVDPNRRFWAWPPKV